MEYKKHKNMRLSDYDQDIVNIGLYLQQLIYNYIDKHNRNLRKSKHIHFFGDTLVKKIDKSSFKTTYKTKQTQKKNILKHINYSKKPSKDYNKNSVIIKNMNNIVNISALILATTKYHRPLKLYLKRVIKYAITMKTPSTVHVMLSKIVLDEVKIIAEKNNIEIKSYNFKTRVLKLSK